MARRLAVLTTGRQDWGLLRPLCARLADDPAFDLEIIAGGMALDPAYGRVIESIRSQGFEVRSELPWDVQQATAWEQAAAATQAVGEVLERLGPEALLVLGDRFETAAAALAATILRVPIVHLYGGEETAGAIDNTMRHAITKLSRLHLVAHASYARRVLQMGEDPATVHVIGSLGVENTLMLPALPLEEIERRLGIALSPTIGLVTVHPTTLSDPPEDRVVESVIAAVRQIDATWVITLPNADQGNAEIRERFEALAATRDNVAVASALGEELYVGVMRHSSVVLGNSSSGMTEAPALGVPTVNVGIRQSGRIRFPTIVDVPADDDAVVQAVRRVLSLDFQADCAPQHALGDAGVSRRTQEILRRWRPSPRKVFVDLQLPDAAAADETRGRL